MKTAPLAFFLIVSASSPTLAAHSHPEKYYQAKWCAAHHGQAEVVLEDQTRADCITTTHAIEFDFGKKWAESLGQALYYSLQTGKRAGIVLILEEPKDRKYFIRLNTTIQHFGLPVVPVCVCWSVMSGNGVAFSISGFGRFMVAAILRVAFRCHSWAPLSLGAIPVERGTSLALFGGRSGGQAAMQLATAILVNVQPLARCALPGLRAAVSTGK